MKGIYIQVIDVDVMLKNVDSHIQRVVLATEETTVTQQVSHRPIECQSRLWLQRGIMLTTRYSDQQGSKSRQNVIRLYKQKMHRPLSKRFINLLTPYREQPRSTRIVVAYPRPAFSAIKRTNYASISFDQQVQVSQGYTSYKKNMNFKLRL